MEGENPIISYLKNHPIKHARDGFYCLEDCNNIIDALRGAGLITVATVELLAGPLVIGGIIVRHHAVVHVHRPSNEVIDPIDICEI